MKGSNVFVGNEPVFVRADVEEEIGTTADAYEIHAEKLLVAAGHILFCEEPFASDWVADFAGHVVFFTLDLAPFDVARVAIGQETLDGDDVSWSSLGDGIG